MLSIEAGKEVEPMKTKEEKTLAESKSYLVQPGFSLGLAHKRMHAVIISPWPTHQRSPPTPNPSRTVHAAPYLSN